MKKLRNLVCVILAMTMLLTSCGSGGRYHCRKGG